MTRAPRSSDDLLIEAISLVEDVCTDFQRKRLRKITHTLQAQLRVSIFLVRSNCITLEILKLFAAVFSSEIMGSLFQDYLQQYWSNMNIILSRSNKVCTSARFTSFIHDTHAISLHQCNVTKSGQGWDSTTNLALVSLSQSQNCLLTLITATRPVQHRQNAAMQPETTSFDDENWKNIIIV